MVVLVCGCIRWNEIYFGKHFVLKYKCIICIKSHSDCYRQAYSNYFIIHIGYIWFISCICNVENYFYNFIYKLLYNFCHFYQTFRSKFQRIPVFYYRSPWFSQRNVLATFTEGPFVLHFSLLLFIYKESHPIPSTKSVNKFKTLQILLYLLTRINEWNC